MADKKPRSRRLQAGDDLIWGLHTVEETLAHAPRTLVSIHVVKGRGGAKLQALIDRARAAGVRVRFEPGLEIEGAGEVNHQGVAARVQPVATVDREDLLDKLRGLDAPFVLALDCIQDPHNLGAILRSAAAAGVHGVVMTRDRSAPLSGTVAKIAAGALAHLDVCTVPNLAIYLGQLKEAGLWVYGTVKEEGRSIHETDLAGSVCLVIGNEEKGLRPLVLRCCDYKVTIPMPGALDSLNASVAAGIALFEVVRQRRG